MELKKIQYFLKIVEKGSLSKAAESLYLTQPTLSRFLATLEEEAGVKLFYRGKNNALSLTERGLRYLEAARQIDRIWKDLQSDLAADPQPHQVLLGIDADSLYPFVTACSEQLTAKFPDVSVQIHRHDALEIQAMVAEGQLDLGITAYDEEDPRLQYILNRSAEVQLIVSPQHPLAASRHAGETQRLSLHQLPPRMPFVLIREATILRQQEDRYLQQQNYEPVIQRTYNQHRSAIDLIAQSTNLIGFCPANYRSNRVVYLPLESPFYYKNGICLRKHTPLSQAAQCLLELLQQQPATNTLD